VAADDAERRRRFAVAAPRDQRSGPHDEESPLRRPLVAFGQFGEARLLQALRDGHAHVER
jgi:hypothetical protein